MLVPEDNKAGVVHGDNELSLASVVNKGDALDPDYLMLPDSLVFIPYLRVMKLIDLVDIAAGHVDGEDSISEPDSS